MIKQYKIRFTETMQDYREMYSEFKCNANDFELVIRLIRGGYNNDYIKDRVPSFVLLNDSDWDTYETECMDNDFEIEEETELQAKKNHLPGWF